MVLATSRYKPILTQRFRPESTYQEAIACGGTKRPDPLLGCAPLATVPKKCFETKQRKHHSCQPKNPQPFRKNAEGCIEVGERSQILKVARLNRYSCRFLLHGGRIHSRQISYAWFNKIVEAVATSGHVITDYNLIDSHFNR